MNAVERGPIPTRVLNPNASEASNKSKQRSYGKNEAIKIIQFKKNYNLFKLYNSRYYLFYRNKFMMKKQ